MFASLVLACFGVGSLGVCLVLLTTLRRRSHSRIQLLLGGVPLLVVVAGALVIILFTVTDGIAFHNKPLPGTTYIVDGHRMRIDCQGSDQPTLVLDAGLGNDGLIWSGVQTALAKTARTCSFDRAGYGESDLVATRRDASDLSIELHDLLKSAGIRSPIILVGHSIAGLYIRDYALHYPEEVAGLIFVDASVPPDVDNASVVRKESRPSSRNAFETAMFAVGLNRLIGACPGSLPGERLFLVAPRLEGVCREHLATFQEELGAFDISAREAAAFRSTSLPILILSRDTHDESWNQNQDRLRTLSHDSKRVVVTHSGHYIQVDQPSSFEEQVRTFVERLRDRSSRATSPAVPK